MRTCTRQHPGVGPAPNLPSPGPALVPWPVAVPSAVDVDVVAVVVVIVPAFGRPLTAVMTDLAAMLPTICKILHRHQILLVCENVGVRHTKHDELKHVGHAVGRRMIGYGGGFRE